MGLTHGDRMRCAGWGRAGLGGWRGILLVVFNGALLLWLLLKPASREVVAGVDDIACTLGPLLGAVWCLVGRGCGASAAQGRGARWSWVCLMLGVLAFACGQGVWSYYELVLRRPMPFPSVADAGFLVAYPCLLLGVLLLPGRSMAPVVRWRVLLDSLTTMAALVTFSWYFLLGPKLAQGGETPLARVLGPLYPAFDLVLLFAVLMLSARRMAPGMRGAAACLCAGFGSIIVIDTAFAYGALDNSYATGWVVDLGWPLGYMLVGLAAWKIKAGATRRECAEAAGAGGTSLLARMQEPSMWRSLLPYALVPLVAALLCYAYAHGAWDSRAWGVYIGSAALMLLVLARQFFVVCENHGLFQRVRAAYAEIISSHQSLEVANRRLHGLATTDGMTLLANHRAFQERLREEIARGRRSGEPVGLLLIDVDDFKKYNDAFGHPAGDEVLRTVAALLQSCIRDSDTPARYGGEEFAIILPDASRRAAASIAERIRACIADHSFGSCRVTVSIGVACTHAAGDDAAALIGIADQELYAAKAAGRNRVCSAIAPHAQRPPSQHRREPRREARGD